MENLELRLAGSGGQGLILAARILFRAFALDGKQVAQSQSYEPTSRGGFCHADLVVSDGPVDYPLVTGIDMLLALDQVGADASAGGIKPGALVLADERLTPSPPAGDYRIHRLPLTDRAIALGSPRVANVVALGALLGLTGLCPREHLEQAVGLETPESFRDMNLDAVADGFRLAVEVAGSAGTVPETLTAG